MLKFGLKAGRTVLSSAVWQGTSPTGLVAVVPCIGMYLLLFIIWVGQYNNIRDGVTVRKARVMRLWILTIYLSRSLMMS